MTTYRTVLRNGEFRAFLAAHVFSMLAIVGSDIAMTVLVYERTGSPALAAATFAVGFVPMGLGGLFLGHVGRHRPARDVLVATELATAGLVALMALPGMPVLALLLLLAVKGTIDPIFSGTRAATLPELLGEDGYPLGRSLLRIVSQNTQLVGFAVGGLALAFVPPTQALLIAGGGYVVSAAVLLVCTSRRPAVVAAPSPTPGPGAGSEAAGPDAGQASRPADAAATRLPGSSGPAPARRVLADTLTSLRALRAVPGIGQLVALSWLPGFFAVAPEALAVPYAHQLGGGTVAAGLLLAGLPMGAVLGELLAGSFLTSERRARLLVPLAAGGFVPVLLFVWSPGLPVAVALLVIAGLGNSFYLGLDQLVVGAVPEVDRRPVFTLIGAGTMVTQGLGFAAAGTLAEWLPIEVVLPFIAACGLAAVVAAGRRLPVPAPPVARRL